MLLPSLPRFAGHTVYLETDEFCDQRLSAQLWIPRPTLISTHGRGQRHVFCQSRILLYDLFQHQCPDGVGLLVWMTVPSADPHGGHFAEPLIKIVCVQDGRSSRSKRLLR